MDETKQNAAERQQTSTKPVDLKNYHDLGGVSLGKLEFGLWYLEHREGLRKFLVIVLSAISVVSWGYFIFSFSYYLAKGMKEDQRLQQELVANEDLSHQIIERNKPKNLLVETPIALGGNEGKYDYVAAVRNPNNKLWVEITYYFMVDGQPSGRASAFILPDESKYLMLLGEKTGSRPNNLEVRLDNISWHRLNPKTIPDWESYRSERLGIEIKDIVFTPANASGLSEKLNLSQLDFTAQNKTAYNFWRTDFYILFKSRGMIVGVNRHNIERFKSGESRTVTSNQPGQMLGVDKVEIIPEINVMDPGAYMKF